MRARGHGIPLNPIKMGGGLIQQVERARNRQQGEVQKKLVSVLRLRSTGAEPGVSYLSF